MALYHLRKVKEYIRSSGPHNLLDNFKDLRESEKLNTDCTGAQRIFWNAKQAAVCQHSALAKNSHGLRVCSLHSKQASLPSALKMKLPRVKWQA